MADVRPAIGDATINFPLVTSSVGADQWFDAYVIVDWSANGKPKSHKDSIWFAVGTRVGATLCIEEPVNPRTRFEARRLLAERLHALVVEGRRILVGFDFPYGYPSGFAAARGVEGTPEPWRKNWYDLLARIEDNDRNANNRFAVAADLNAVCGHEPGPFWNHPKSKVMANLTQTKGSFPCKTVKGLPLAEYRLTEQRLQANGHSPHSVWKLFTAGSVGSQSLMGIPILATLRDDPLLAPVSKVWPFETGFMRATPAATGPRLIHAEIWPGVIPIDETLHPIKDAAQVTSLLQYLAARDDDLSLAGLFAPPSGLSREAISQCIDEEGWILGVL